jgi:hypothetical protein
MALPGIVVYHAAMEICGIVFGRTLMAAARNRVMVTGMAVALEEDGNGEGRKNDGDGDEEGNGER